MTFFGSGIWNLSFSLSCAGAALLASLPILCYTENKNRHECCYLLITRTVRCMTEERERTTIVFVHGIMGFRSIRVLGREIVYFKGLADYLGDLPVSLHFPVCPPSETVKVRAEALASYISTNVKCRDVHLIAHSMGGLDSRYLIHHLDPGKRVKTLATLGTPHRGTPLTDWFLNAPGIVPYLGRRFATPGAHDLTPEACSRFNSTVSDRPDVRYLSYAGCRPVDQMPCWLRRWTRLIEEKAGENDGQVPVSSAQWGEFRGFLRADHFELVGWNLGLGDKGSERPFNHLMLYRSIIEELLKSGGEKPLAA